ncbi:MAG TPA: hypothetical protein VF622_12470, partial [Segetibacter sp.]
MYLFNLFSLNKKTILLISPQFWGEMFISKHHYALELAKKGNNVYFLNPPSESRLFFKGLISIQVSSLNKNLFLINHSLFFPYNLKFHFISVFHWLMGFHLRRLLKKIGKVDIVWSFDLGNLYPFAFFPQNALKIFHPVDEPQNKAAIASAKGSDVIFSVTSNILERFKRYDSPKYLINHGISPDFFSSSPQCRKDSIIRIGISGNLLRKDIDRYTLLQIVYGNPEVIFECWGNYTLKDGNIGGDEDRETLEFIDELKKSNNVRLHGAVPHSQLARELLKVDAFLICYDIKKDQSKGSNYHKVMEFLSTGKVIISNNISSYTRHSELIQMVTERDSNNKLPGLVKEVISDLCYYNSLELQKKRRCFA